VVDARYPQPVGPAQYLKWIECHFVRKLALTVDLLIHLRRLQHHTQPVEQRPRGSLITDICLLMPHESIQERTLRGREARLRIQHFERGNRAQFVLLLFGFRIFPRQIARARGGFNRSVRQVDRSERLPPS